MVERHGSSSLPAAREYPDNSDCSSSYGDILDRKVVQTRERLIVRVVIQVRQTLWSPRSERIGTSVRHSVEGPFPFPLIWELIECFGSKLKILRISESVD